MAPVFEVRRAHTAELAAAERTAVLDLLTTVFPAITDHETEHVFGGMHALGWDGEALVAHAAVVQRRLVHNGRARRGGYVEGVAVHPGHRRRGRGGAVMAAVEDVIRRAYDLGALASTDEARAFYGRRGWSPWTGPTSALTPTGTVRTSDGNDCLFVLPVTEPLDPTGELTCGWRDGDLW
jgi:aminoglycoside 2'-N-acetyltransferase I